MDISLMTTSAPHGVFRARAGNFSRRALAKMESGGWALFDECMVGAANILTIFLFARYLHTDAFIGFMLGYVGLLVALVVQPANALAVGPGEPPLQQFARALAARQGRWCIGLCMGLAVSGCIVLALGQESAGSVVLALAFVAVPFLGQEMVRWMLYTRDGSRAAAINDGITYGLQMFGTLVLVSAAAQWATAVSALSVLGLSAALGLALGCWQLRQQVRNESQRDDAVEAAQTRRERPGVPLSQRLAGT